MSFLQQLFVCNSKKKAYKESIIPNTKDFDEKIENSYIMYWDANNLYGWAMMQHLPDGKFKNEENVNQFTPQIIQNLDDDATFLK